MAYIHWISKMKRVRGSAGERFYRYTVSRTLGPHLFQERVAALLPPAIPEWSQSRVTRRLDSLSLIGTCSSSNSSFCYSVSLCPLLLMYLVLKIPQMAFHCLSKYSIFFFQANKHIPFSICAFDYPTMLTLYYPLLLCFLLTVFSIKLQYHQMTFRNLQ